MERFESEISKILDFNRFELQPEMQELISGFEKSYLGGEKESGRREPISFSELQGEDRADTRTTKPEAGRLSREKEKDKGSSL